MSNQIQIPIALGQVVWWTGYGSRTDYIQCPECCGTCVIEMIKGNGERVTLDCGLCSVGYEPPTGKIKQYVYEHTPTPFVAGRVRMDGDEFWYSESPPDASSYSSVKSTDLFASREECQARCDELNRERAKADEEMLLRNISHKRQHLSFSASYWSREVKKLEKQIDAARARINRCKAKSA